MNIYYNAKIYTMDEAYPLATYMAVENGRIVETGTDFNKGMYSSCRMIDMGGQTLLPGLIDAHLHLLEYSRNLYSVNLGAARSVDEITGMLRERLNKENKGGWLYACCFDDTKLPGNSRVDRYVLDKVSSSTPILVSRICGHKCVVNSAALEIIREDLGQYNSGEIEYDEKGRSTGHLVERAKRAAQAKARKISLKDDIVMVRRGIKEVLSKGITSVHTQYVTDRPADIWKEYADIYRTLEQDGQLDIRTYLHMQANEPEDIEKIREYGFKTGRGTNRMRFGAIKIFQDGSFGAATAALTKPYIDCSGRGLLCYPEKTLYELVKKAHRAGFQTAVHAIGDRAALSYLEVLDRVMNEYPADLRHRLIHCSILNKKALELMEKLNVLADMQPSFIADDISLLERRVPSDMYYWAYPFNSMLENGIIVSGGSDCPNSDLNPFTGLFAAVTRKRTDGYPGRGWVPMQKITLYQALKMYTVNAAYASFEEDIKGSLSVGKLADFIVVDRDPFSISDDEIKDLKVLKTFVEGREVMEQ